jgi:hypothetical protein
MTGKRLGFIHIVILLLALLLAAPAALADDPEKRRNLARRGEEFVQKYSLENIIPRWEALL